ncbi:MAG: methyltransferase domain-containing protein [Acidobacteriota bacterium]
MTNHADRDYVLGTGDEEIQRLGLQHRVWRPTVLDCWKRAGITVGSRVLDVGAGPGYATLDLAEIVGATGQVIAVERSQRFVQAAQAASRSRGFAHVQVHELDLMNDALPAERMDAAWCRWVASFVSSPSMLVSKLAGIIRPGGVVVFHEYVDYSTFRFVPENEAHAQFVQHVMASWRASGGEPDIARVLPSLLDDAGLRVRSTRPHIFCTSPADQLWQWPASFIGINLKRMVELGRVDQAWADMAQQKFDAASADPRSLILTPLVLEIIAEKAGGA